MVSVFETISCSSGSDEEQESDSWRETCIRIVEKRVCSEASGRAESGMLSELFFFFGAVCGYMCYLTFGLSSSNSLFSFACRFLCCLTISKAGCMDATFHSFKPCAEQTQKRA